MKHIFIFLFFGLAVTFVHAQSNCSQWLNCPSVTPQFCDYSTNNEFLWNQSPTYDSTTQSVDLSEGTVDLSIRATSTCGPVQVRFVLFLDLNDDGTKETALHSDSIANWPAGTVPFANAANPNYGGGSLINFDSRPISNNDKYRFALQSVTSGDTTTASLRWITNAQSGGF
jgi:hypothetical protein